jgi:hypothetical protein
MKDAARGFVRIFAGVCALAVASACQTTGGPSQQRQPDPSVCPPAEPAPAGYRFYSQPRCAYPNAYNDPAPDLRCTTTEYYCCAKQTGATGGRDGRCGQDHAEFPPDCMFGLTNVRQFPTGCYQQN